MSHTGEEHVKANTVTLLGQYMSVIFDEPHASEVTGDTVGLIWNQVSDGTKRGFSIKHDRGGNKLVHGITSGFTPDSAVTPMFEIKKDAVSFWNSLFIGNGGIDRHNFKSVGATDALCHLDLFSDVAEAQLSMRVWGPATTGAAAVSVIKSDRFTAAGRASIGTFNTASSNFAGLIAFGGTVAGDAMYWSTGAQESNGNFYILRGLMPPVGEAATFNTANEILAVRIIAGATNAECTTKMYGRTECEHGAYINAYTTANGFQIANLATSASAANLYLDTGTNNVYRSTSSRKEKTHIRPTIIDSRSVLTLNPKRFSMRNDPAQKDWIGYMAEESADPFVDRNGNGEAQGIDWQQITTHLVELNKGLYNACSKMAKRLDMVDAFESCFPPPWEGAVEAEPEHYQYRDEDYVPSVSVDPVLEEDEYAPGPYVITAEEMAAYLAFKNARDGGLV